MNVIAPIRSATMRRALTDPNLLGRAVQAPSWTSWRALLIAGNGEALEPDEREVFTRLTGRAHEPMEPVEESYTIAGRRAGKSRASAMKAVYASCFVSYENVLAPGERGIVLVLSASQRQASVILGYCIGLLESAPMLAGLIRNRTADTISLSNGIDIEVRAANFRQVRGLTLVCACVDELSYMFDEASGSANPDSEILSAIRPALATTHGSLVCIGSPYARRGEMFANWEEHFGEKGDPRILVAKGSSRDFNPSLPQSIIDRAMKKDPIKARTEWLAEWRSDVEQFLSREALDGVVIPGRIELPPIIGQTYVAFVDPSGGAIDSMTLGIAHAEGDTVLLDCIREVHPPFSPASVVERFVEVIRRYGLSEVTGDRWGGQFVQEQFQARGVTYQVSARNKSQIYVEALALINSKRVELLDLPRMHSQLLGLERRVGRGGARESIDHAPGAHDDIGNSACGCIVLASGVGGDTFSVDEFIRAWTPGMPSYFDEQQERLRLAALATEET